MLNKYTKYLITKIESCKLFVNLGLEEKFLLQLMLNMEQLYVLSVTDWWN
jgi:hypothetical protein